MGTLKVDNIQTESGSAIITNGAIPAAQLRSSNVGFTLLSTQTASSSASINFDSSVITTDYESYYVIINGLIPATNQTTLRFRFSTDNGSSYLSQNYAARSSGGKAHTGADSSGSSNNAAYLSLIHI